MRKEEKKMREGKRQRERERESEWYKERKIIAQRTVSIKFSWSFV